ncbi:hypothetical protein [Streptomyces sp. NPDC054834]
MSESLITWAEITLMTSRLTCKPATCRPALRPQPVPLLLAA